MTPETTNDKRHDLMFLCSRVLFLFPYQLPYYQVNTSAQFCISGHEEIVEISLAQGADINIQDEDGRSVLFLAIRNRYRRMAEMYIERSIDINLVSEMQLTILMC